MSEFTAPTTTPVTLANVNSFGSANVASLFNPTTGTGAGSIQFDPTSLPTSDKKRSEIIDYVRMRLGDGLVDVELEDAFSGG